MRLWEKLVAAFSLSAVMAAVVVKMTDAPDEGVRLTSAAAARLNEAVKPEMFPPAMGHRLEDISSQSNGVAPSNDMTFTREDGDEDEESRLIRKLENADCFTSEPKNGILPSNNPVCLEGLPELKKIMKNDWVYFTGNDGHEFEPRVMQLENILDLSRRIAKISGGDDGLSALGLRSGEFSWRFCRAARAELDSAQKEYNDLSQKGFIDDGNKDESTWVLEFLKSEQDRYCAHQTPQ